MLNLMYSFPFLISIADIIECLQKYKTFRFDANFLFAADLIS